MSETPGAERRQGPGVEVPPEADGLTAGAFGLCVLPGCAREVVRGDSSNSLASGALSGRPDGRKKVENPETGLEDTVPGLCVHPKISDTFDEPHVRLNSALLDGETAAGDDPNVFSQADGSRDVNDRADLRHSMKEEKGKYIYNLLTQEGYGIRASVIERGLLDARIQRGPGTPRGSELLEMAMRHFGDRVTGIRGDWRRKLSDNLDSFNAATGRIDEALGWGSAFVVEIACRRRGPTSAQTISNRGPTASNAALP